MTILNTQLPEIGTLWRCVASGDSLEVRDLSKRLILLRVNGDTASVMTKVAWGDLITVNMLEPLASQRSQNHD